MPRIGMMELFVMPIILLTTLLPVLVAVWVIVALQRIRSGQEAIRERIDAIERLLQRNATGHA